MENKIVVDIIPGVVDVVVVVVGAVVVVVIVVVVGLVVTFVVVLIVVLVLLFLEVVLDRKVSLARKSTGLKHLFSVEMQALQLLSNSRQSSSKLHSKVTLIHDLCCLKNHLLLLHL
jgi:hypothetical protein